jgi:hypothetical protein
MESFRLSDRKAKVVVMEKSSIEWESKSRAFASQAVMRPPEAPSDGLKTKERREGGRKEEARKVEMSASFVS